MTEKNTRFPTIGLMIGLIVFAACLGLAAWQWQRAEQARSWLAQERQKAASPPVSLEQAVAMRDRQHQPVMVQGRIDNAHPVLLDNRIHQGQAGYYLLSPLQSRDGRWVLVNRGWLPAGKYRDQLPSIPPISGKVTVRGTVYQPSHNVFMPSGGPLPDNQWPLRVPEVNFAAIGTQLGVDLARFEVRLGPDQRLGASTGLPRPWKEVQATISPARHIAYAVQWVAIGTAGLVVFALAGRRRRAHHRRS